MSRTIATPSSAPRSWLRMSAPRTRAALDQVFIAIGLDRGQARGARERRTAERAAVCAGRQHVADRLGVRERAHRESAAEALGQAHDVGLDAGVLDREPLAGAAESGLDLVDDQHRAALAADLLRGLQEVRRADVDAAFTLDHFEHDRGGLIGDRLVERRRIVELHVRGLEQRAKALAILRLPRHRQRAHRPAVKPLGRGDERGALREQAARTSARRPSLRRRCWRGTRAADTSAARRPAPSRTPRACRCRDSSGQSVSVSACSWIAAVTPGWQ